jgi:serine/threonine-protein kinase
MTARIPFEGEVLGDIVLRVCVAPLPVATQLNPQAPSGFDAWFARACNRDPQKRFTSAQEAGDAIELVCGVMDRPSEKSLVDVAEVQYQLKPRSPEFSSEDIEVPSSMSPRTALLAGLVLGLTVMVGIVGAIAWRSGVLDPDSASPATSATSSTTGSQSSTGRDGGTDDAARGH